MYRKYFLVGVFFISCLAACSQSTSGKKPEEMIRRYWFVLLTKGEQRAQDSVTASKIQAGHMNNIKRLYGEGKIKVAGPFGNDKDQKTINWQGLFIYDCETKEEVEQLLQTDPAVKAGRLAYQILSWYTAPVGSFVPGKPPLDTH